MIMTFAGGLYAVADDVDHLINTHCKVGRLTIPSAVADRLSIFAVAKRFVQPQRVGSLFFCCLVITGRAHRLSRFLRGSGRLRGPSGHIPFGRQH